MRGRPAWPQTAEAGTAAPEGTFVTVFVRGKPEVRRHATPFHSPHFSKHRFTLQCVPSSGPPGRLASMFRRELRLSPAIGRSRLARFSILSRRTRYSGAKGLGA